MSPKLLIIALGVTLSMFAATPALASRCDKEKGHQHKCEHAVTIYVGASLGATPKGGLFDHLRQDFNIVSLPQRLPSPFFYEPIVVGPADLTDPAVVKMLLDVYSAGRTVAIAGATVPEADRFHRILGAPGGRANCRAIDDGLPIPLYGLQKTVARRPPTLASYCLNGIAEFDRRGNRSSSTRTWLVEHFALSPPEVLPPGDNPDGSAYLDSLVKGTECDFKDTNDPNNLGRELSLSQTVLSIRNFSFNPNQQDLYQVTATPVFNVSSSSAAPSHSLYYKVLRFGAGGLQNIDAMLGNDTPQDATSTLTYTYGTDSTTGGSVGWDGNSGPDANINYSVTVDRSVSSSVPAIEIANQSTTNPPFPAWVWSPMPVQNGTRYTEPASWVWYVDRTAYTDDGIGSAGITFLSTVGIDNFVGEAVCQAPYAFPLWSLAAPQITGFTDTNGVSITQVSRSGGTFRIVGLELYPNFVTAVLVAGNQLMPGNYVPQPDMSILVTLPSSVSFPTGSQPVEVETTFNGQTQSSNILNIDITK